MLHFSIKILIKSIAFEALAGMLHFSIEILIKRIAFEAPAGILHCSTRPLLCIRADTRLLDKTPATTEAFC